MRSLLVAVLIAAALAVPAPALAIQCHPHHPNSWPPCARVRHAAGVRP